MKTRNLASPWKWRKSFVHLFFPRKGWKILLRILNTLLFPGIGLEEFTAYIISPLLPGKGFKSLSCSKNFNNNAGTFSKIENK